MEIDITEIVEYENPADYAASVFELGQDAGAITWAAAVQSADRLLVLESEWREEVTRWLRGFGAWGDDELARMSDREVKALLLQFIAGDLREAGFDYFSEQPFDWDAYEKREDTNGRVFRGDGGKIYYDIGD